MSQKEIIESMADLETWEVLDIFKEVLKDRIVYWEEGKTWESVYISIKTLLNLM